MDRSYNKEQKRCVKKGFQDDCFEENPYHSSIYNTRRKYGLNYRINPGHKQWITYIMGTGVPLLNEYKLEFFAKRFPQTILGGLKLHIGYEAPVYVYISQIVLFCIPFLIGGMFTLLVELDVISKEIAAYTFGALMIAYVLLTQLITHISQMNQSDLPVMQKKKNLLAEEDEVEFMSCCDPETIKFVLPPKKYKLNVLIHAIVAGPMCGLGLWYLLPKTTLNLLYSNATGGSVILFILGWFTILVAQYPLTTVSPPETATFRTTDILELSSLMRAFYVYIFIMFDLLHRYLSASSFLLTNQVLHIIFLFLPIFWMLGLLAPVNTFLLYLLEQAHVFLFGGSFMASDLRLIIMVTLSTSVYFGAYYIRESLGTVIMSALAGYLLSTDLGGLGSQLFALFARNKVSAVKILEPTRISLKRWFLWQWGPLEVLYHVVMFAVVGLTAGFLNKNSITLSAQIWKILGYTIIGACMFEKILRDIQGVFIVFGLWRNMIFPASLQDRNVFLCRKALLRPLGFIHRGLVNWVAPLLMLAYLSLTITSSDPTSVSVRATLDLATGIWYVLGVVRAFRWIWQGTVYSLLELSIVHILMITMTTNTTVTKWGVPILAMLIGLCRDRAFQLSNKVFFVITHLISSWTDRKQRRGSTIPIIVLSVILFPVVLGITVLAAALSVPLLPLFTLPVFFFSFPRPLRSWPEDVGASANSCPDSNFYKQLVPELSKSLSSAFANGSLGEAVPGNHYLVRFQDRLAWVMILERGAAYCTINIKGLELQETSCHTVEAARIDDIFENAFELSDREVCCIGRLNEYPLHTLTPADACYLQAYSDARNVLTGVIDAPSSTEETMISFLKCLVWVLLKHVNTLKMEENKKLKSDKVFDKELSFSAHQDKLEMKAIESESYKTKPANLQEQVKTTLPSSVLDLTRDSQSKALPPLVNPKQQNKLANSWGSLDSFTDSIFSDDGTTTKKKESKALPAVMSHVRNKSWDIENILDNLDMGLPAYDVTKPKPTTQNKFGIKSTGNTIYKPLTNLAGSPDFNSPFSSLLSLPKEWRELPLDISQVSKSLGRFPIDWYKHVLSCLHLKTDSKSDVDVLKEIVMDEALRNCYAQLTIACYSIFESQGYSGPSFLYKCYMGDVSINAMWDWLDEHKDLKDLVKKSFRYGFKLMMDQMLVGTLTSNDEWQETLEEYDKDWYIGLEQDPQWTEAILRSTPQLFSLGHNNTQSTYNSRTLTLKEMDVKIGRLNPEVVRGQWANLGLELIYMTNDDEERYSIQAHPVVLRNLTVQAADPPLGYPIFSSKPISIPLV